MNLAYCISFLFFLDPLFFLSLFLRDINNFASEFDQGHLKLQFENFYFCEVYLNFVITLKANMLKYKVATNKFQHINSNECSNEWMNIQMDESWRMLLATLLKEERGSFHHLGKQKAQHSADKGLWQSRDLLQKFLMFRQIHTSRNRPSMSYI